MNWHRLLKSSKAVNNLRFYGINHYMIFFSKKSKCTDGAEIPGTCLRSQTKNNRFMTKYPNIKALRIQNNYKQEYVADILGVSQPEYSKIETGGRRLDAFIITELCKLYDVKMDDLLKRNVPRIIHATAGEPTALDGYGFQDNHELLNKLMHNYTALIENYVKQQQTTERIISKLFEQQRA